MNENCLTPVQVAAQENNPSVAKMLLKYGCDLDAHAKVDHLMKCCFLHDDSHPHLDLEPMFHVLTHKNLELMRLFIQCYHCIPTGVVKNLANIFHISFELRAHFSQALKNDVSRLLLKTLKFPRLLQECCRAVIRERMGARLQMDIEELPLAKKLRNYVIMQSIFTSDEEVESDTG